MPHITLPDDVPGIRSLALYRPDTGEQLYALAAALLRGESPLTAAERELIAAFVSAENACVFCSCSHAAAARVLFGLEKNLVDAVLKDYESAPISGKMKSLLAIAAAVQRDARTVTPALVAAARSEGAGDRDIHDAVLIAATFCLFNRYVDGLATLTPASADAYEAMGERMASIGYQIPKNP